jgi:hypothetical protein
VQEGWGALKAVARRVRSRRLRSLASLLLACGGVTALVAALLPAFSSAARADAPPTQPGSAFATAVVLAANPQYGGLSLVVRGGQSTASYTGSQTVATSQAVNLGYIGGLLNGPPNACYGSTGPSATAAVNALQATSSSGASSSTADNGIEGVSVNPTPETAGSTTNLTPISIPNFLTVTAHAVAHADYVADQDQQADASTTMSLSLLGGLVTLNGLVWTAHQETGATDAATATFSMTSITASGHTTPIASPSQLALALPFVNKLLGVAGLTLTLPVESTDPVTGTVTMGPLQLQLVGTALTNTVLDSLNSTETTLEEEIGKALDAGNSACFKVIASYVGDTELIGGIVEGIMAGGGVVDLDLGGASADTEVAPNYANPLGSSGATIGLSNPSLPSTGIGTAPATGTFGQGTGLVGGDISPSGSGTPAAASGHPAGSTALAAASGPVQCVSTSPSGHGCWSGAATVGAAVLLALGGALLVADVVRSRRRILRPKETL